MKLHFSLLWGIYLILAVFSQMIRTFLILFLLLFFHEMAHVLMAKVFGYEVKRVVVTPFGMMAEIPHVDHAKVMEKIIILSAGLLMHLLYPFLFELCFSLHFISNAYMEYLKQLNLAILYFNLLPIYPLDGGRLLLCFLELFIPYYKARIITQILALIFMSFLFLRATWNIRIFVIFLWIMVMMEMKTNKLDEVNYHYHKKNHLKTIVNHV